MNLFTRFNTPLKPDIVSLQLFLQHVRRLREKNFPIVLQGNSLVLLISPVYFVFAAELTHLFISIKISKILLVLIIMFLPSMELCQCIGCIFRKFTPLNRIARFHFRIYHIATR